MKLKISNYERITDIAITDFWVDTNIQDKVNVLIFV